MSGRDIAVEYLEREADARDQKEANEVGDPRRLLWETATLTNAAARFRELPTDDPAIVGLEAVLEGLQRNEKAFLARFAQMVRRETGIDIRLDQ